MKPAGIKICEDLWFAIHAGLTEFVKTLSNEHPKYL